MRLDMPKAATMNSENMAVETVPGAKEDEVKAGGGCGPGQSKVQSSWKCMCQDVFGDKTQKCMASAEPKQAVIYLPF